MPNLFNKTIRLFLDGIGQRDEYEFYLKKFQQGTSPIFALICPHHESIDEAVAVFRFDLELLIRLELTPLILLCGSHASAMSRSLLEESKHIKLMTSHVQQIADFPLADVKEFATTCRASRAIPVLVVPNLDMASCVSHCASTLCKRVHIIRPDGTLTDVQGHSYTYYYTCRPHDSPLIAEDQWVIDVADAVLSETPSAHVSLASSWDLLQELFTVHGAGCLIRRGAVITRFDHPQFFSIPRLLHLLEDSFGKKIIDVQRVLEPIQTFYIEEHYRGAGLLEETPEGMYLSKFAVGTEARGEGIAQELWQEIAQDHPQLFWRAKITNPINAWYEKKAHGYFATDTWRVFWRNIPAEHISSIIAYSLSRSEDFYAPETSCVPSYSE